MWAYLLSGTLALMVAIGFGRFAYTPMIPIMMEQANLSIAWAGYIASFNYLGYTIGALTPLFWKGEHVRVPALRAGLVLTVVGFLLMSFQWPANSSVYAQTLSWCLARLLNGIGSAWILINISSLLLEKLDAHKRLNLMGVLYAGVGLGSLLITLIIYFLNSVHITWSVDWQLLALFSAVLSIPAWVLWRPSEKKSLSNTLPVGKFSDINLPAVWWLALAYFGKGFSYIIVMTFLPVITQDMGFFAEKSWLILTFAAIPSSMLWGYLSDRLGNLNCLKMAYVMLLCALLSLYGMPGAFGAVVCAVLLGSSFMGIVTMVLAQARFIKPVVATMIMALVTGIYSTGQVLGPGVAGYIAAMSGSFDLALLLAIALLVVSLFALFRIEKYMPDR